LTLQCGRYRRNTANEAVVFGDAGRTQLMPRGLLGAAPGSAPPHAAAPGNSPNDCRFGPSAGSGASPHVWLAGQPALDPMAPLDDAASAIYSAFLVAEEGTASAFRAARPAWLANTACYARMRSED
jgi:hypothetical protein